MPYKTKIKPISKLILFSPLVALLLYVLVALILSSIQIDSECADEKLNRVYLSTNGVHLDIVIPINKLTDNLKKDLKVNKQSQFLSFGWGDENFYLNTPTWGDLTVKNGFGALFLKSTTLMHVTQYRQQQNNWVLVKVSNKQLIKLQNEILNSFLYNENNQKQVLPEAGYTKNDNFYSANGSYSCFNTCNTWANSCFKKSGLNSCIWTPFDFGLLNCYKNKGGTSIDNSRE